MKRTVTILPEVKRGIFSNLKVGSFLKDKEASINNLVGAAIGITILCIVIFTVAIPQITEAINASNITGTDATLANLVPTFMIIGAFVIVVAVFVLRWL